MGKLVSGMPFEYCISFYTSLKSHILIRNITCTTQGVSHIYPVIIENILKMIIIYAKITPTEKNRTIQTP